MSGTLAETYLASRGLKWPTDTPLRFHPACPRGRERLPAMLAEMTDPLTGEFCGTHRTFIEPDGSGKIRHGSAKMMLGRAGTIRLTPDEDVTTGLGICEGIETGLSLIQRAKWQPIWACCSAGGIAKFPVLDGIEHLTIFADADDSGVGLRAAESCARRWREAGREVEITLPPIGKDWLDALTKGDAA